MTWTRDGNPYWIEGNVLVTAGSMLRMEPGVQVRFNGGPGLGLIVEGRLEIQGSAYEPVLLTTNVTFPTPLPWNLNARLDGTIVARNATLEYGGLSFDGQGDLSLERTAYVNAASGILIQAVRNAWITGGRIELSNTLGNGVEVHQASSLNVSSNAILSLSRGAKGIDAANVPNPVIRENVIRRFSAGMSVAGRGAVVAGNDIGDTTSDGIQLRSTDAVVSGNRISGCPQWGVVLFGDSSRTVVKGNLVSGCGIGIDVAYVSQSNVVSDNVVVNSTYWGIVLDSVSYASVVNNTVASSGRLGIGLWGGAGHRVYHNWILNNAVQANDTSTGSVWDWGYPTGGNHWSDYLGDDLYQGPNQDIPGPDGFGDTPYVIDADSRDRFPFYSAPASGTPRELTARAAGSDVVLTWRPVPGADAYLLYTARDPTRFDFSSPIVLGNVTSWTDAGASAVPGERYYVLRARNTTVDRSSATGNTAGTWTRAFPAGKSTLSLPLAPYPWIDYAGPGWLDTVGEFLASTGASSLEYMDPGSWRHVPGDGDIGRVLRRGEGYVVEFPAPTTVTFAGVPGAMIDYGDWPPYPLAGFDPATTAREVAAAATGGDIVIEWTQLPDFPPPNGTYRVYGSRTPTGLRGVLGVDYDLLATVPATAGSRVSFMHSGALAQSPEWYYLVVPVRDGWWRGSSTYSVGVVATGLGPGYAAIGLPLRPYANGTYATRNLSSLLVPAVQGVLWYDATRGDWVAHAAWMPPGTYDAVFEMIMAVQVDVASPTRIVFAGV